MGMRRRRRGRRRRRRRRRRGGGLESARGPDESRRSPVRGFLRFSQEASL